MEGYLIHRDEKPRVRQPRNTSKSPRRGSSPEEPSSVPEETNAPPDCRFNPLKAYRIYVCDRCKKTENLSFEGDVLRWTIPEHRSSRSYFARNGSIMAQRWRGLALVVHCMSSAARGIGPKNIKPHCFCVLWCVYVLFYCYWSSRVYKKTFSYILNCQYIISIIWIIHSVEYTYNEVLQVRYRIGLMDNVESRFARTRF